MRAVVQLVSRAHVAADGSVTGEIAMGLLILLGVGRDDTSAVAASMAEKISNLRLEDWFVPVLFQEKDDPQLSAKRRLQSKPWRISKRRSPPA
jgi:hypothetical protein